MEMECRSQWFGLHDVQQIKRFRLGVQRREEKKQARRGRAGQNTGSQTAKGGAERLPSARTAKRKDSETQGQRKQAVTRAARKPAAQRSTADGT